MRSPHKTRAKKVRVTFNVCTMSVVQTLVEINLGHWDQTET